MEYLDLIQSGKEVKHPETRVVIEVSEARESVHKLTCKARKNT